ncbi:MAG: prepilin-type N-terminal cleavage/methylation domain-containing protein [Opitutales bacterium]
MNRTCNSEFIRSRRSAFTLIELLVVISIILIAASILFVGGRGGGGAKLSTAQRIVSSIAQGARGQAILKNAKTRLIIYSDNNTGSDSDPDKMLRYFGIIYADPESADMSKPDWIAGTKGTYLPEGIYFDPDGGPDAAIGSNPWDDSNTMNLEYPRASAQAEGSGPEYYYYSFNRNGTMANGFENNWLVFRSGTLKPDESGALAVEFPEAGEEGENLKSAIIFRRVGTTTPVTDPADID